MSAQSQSEDDWVPDCTEQFQQPVILVNETPRGRLAGIEREIGLVLAEMRELLASRGAGMDPVEYEQRTEELLEQFGDLHERHMQGHEEQMVQLIERRYH